MADPWGVLVVPAEGDPGGLRRPGAPVFGLRDELDGWTVQNQNGVSVFAPTEGDGHWHSLNADEWALVLWQDGALVPEGWDRLRRVMSAVEIGSAELGMAGFVVFERALGDMDPEGWEPSHPGMWTRLRVLAEASLTAGLASRVVLLDRVEGRLVERAEVPRG